MKVNTISALMLEMYRLGELSAEDKKIVANALTADDELRLRLEQLDTSDRELRLRYPVENLRLPRRRFPPIRKRLPRIALAAAVALVVAVPVFRIASSWIQAHKNITVAAVPQNSQTDRSKGHTLGGSELALYLKGNQETILPDQTVLREGSTVQLAYTVPAEIDYYGVIFSIDGRAAVTMHYPYRREQSSLLVSGRRTFLNEAYILDDAPDYEVFVFVVSEEPLDVDTILHGAHKIAGEPQAIIEEKSKMVFENYEVETVTILKK
jgi:hypothetical protein